ncbi:hypothetical protein [Streptomyces sp. YIM 98790]|uniref:hypothetical protein n=1 Tax=Streptomyces sp. YIM 98790 TaxID=2689077 RepID=UPI0037DD4E72
MRRALPARWRPRRRGIRRWPRSETLSLESAALGWGPHTGGSVGALSVAAAEFVDGAADSAAHSLAVLFGMLTAGQRGGVGPCCHTTVAAGDKDSPVGRVQRGQDGGQAAVAGYLVEHRVVGQGPVCEQVSQRGAVADGRLQGENPVLAGAPLPQRHQLGVKRPGL